MYTLEHSFPKLYGAVRPDIIVSIPVEELIAQARSATENAISYRACPAKRNMEYSELPERSRWCYDGHVF